MVAVRRIALLLTVVGASLALAGQAAAGGGNYTFDGGTPAERAQVRAALAASEFDWNVVPVQVTIHVGRGFVSHATPGHVWLDADLLSAGRFAWATVQDEYAHQVDFFLFDDAKRGILMSALRAKDWCYGVPGLAHADYGCECFASTLVWSYWQSADNAYRPTSASDESAAMPPAKFRGLVARLLGAPRLAVAVRR